MVSTKRGIGVGAAGTLVYMSCNKGGVVHQCIETFPFTRFGLANAALIIFYLSCRFLKWLFFGRLRKYEVDKLREKVLYTFHELVLGLLMVRLLNVEPFGISIVLKYSGLFLCVLLLKCFHYLSVDRVSTIFYLSLNKQDCNRTLLHLRFALGILLMHYIDIRFMIWFRNELQYDNDNVLLYVFGFEIVNLYPFILSTSFAYLIQFREFVMQLKKGPDFAWTKKTRLLSFADIFFNVVRLAMFIVFTSIFMERFSLPALNIVPASYNSLRLVIGESRRLIQLQRHSIRLLKLTKQLREPSLESIALTDDSCIICREALELKKQNVKRLVCDHAFHVECLESWLSRSSSCPLCRHKL
ncbi:unnamed protein product [Kuraishia capsulata CBS 1993]|uniref:RING-type domain-containing protein n=1 Tax=Kuraishia capsulata CBS 1993 TaxID=1382522 RepID=W6MT47_9ASCO|nr:uncharacterized protein KUCA_T00005535001 [Kuraishia capsulata CBS 1993]CDK29543.1 unnamed protein product [Kuraishia capsulata CBS 1993]